MLPGGTLCVKQSGTQTADIGNKLPLRYRHMLEATSSSSPMDATHQHASRLLQGLAEVVQKKPYPTITIADIVHAAGVSKRSFYEHFSSKEACFLALYSAASALALRTLREAVAPDQPWHSQIEQGLRAYFSHLAAGAGLLRALFFDIHYLGETGARARRAVMQALADFLLDTVNAPSLSPVNHPVMNASMAMAAVGGINELVLMAIEADELVQLEALTQSATELVRLLTQAPRED